MALDSYEQHNSGGEEETRHEILRTAEIGMITGDLTWHRPKQGLQSPFETIGYD